MAESRLRKRDQQYDKLVHGSRKLHRDIENLENAYLLHQQIVKEDENNVRGMIRKELGGSRWAHGGAGKLTTYKSSKDLVDQESKQQKLLQDKSKTKILDKSDQNLDMDKSSGMADKILDLKTKVLRKASSNIIKRDTWCEPSDNKSLKSNNKQVSQNLQNKPDRKNNVVKQNPSLSKAVKSVKRSSSLKREASDSSRSPVVIAGKCKDNKQNNSPVNNFRKQPSKTIPNQNGVESQRRSRIDLFKEREVIRENSEHVNDVMLTQKNVNSNQNNGNESSRSIGKTNTSRKLKAGSNARVSNDDSQSIFLTQQPEPPEIYIDPKKGQVRILAGKDDDLNDVSSLERTKVLIQPGSVHNSVDGNKVTCSVVDNVSSSSPSREIRDIFGLEDFNTMTDRPESRRQNVNSNSPFATTRKCNTEVEFWLRSLGIPDVDKHVRIFADNGIDLTDLEFMSASQLHDMGVTAFGALDKILKGIRDLKNMPITQLESTEGRKLQTSSIAWEEVDNTKNRNSIERSHLKASNVTKKNSCHSNTFVKNTKLTSVVGGSETGRCSSAMSNVSESNDNMKTSARGDNPSFAASTKSSSAKYTEKRPPCAKINSKSKNSNQSQNMNVNTSDAKLKRNNSSASEKLSSKLNNLESKPTKGVLLRQRSSSLTRESSKSSRESIKKAEEKKESRHLRSRSRSADVVKRKALEGVNAAAKKYEERKLKSKENEKSYPPCDEKQKLRRDEMAARHLQREKIKEMTTADGQSSDSEDDVKKQAAGEFDQDQGLENLVTVNILSPPGKSDPRVTSSPNEDRGKPLVMKPDMRKSLRRVEQARKLQHVKPLQLQPQPDIEPPLLSTYKITNKDRDKSQSEPESGYRTDGSTTYSQIEDRVSDIQRKIRRLKSRATSGDDMTLTLVHDLQEQLLHFERQLKDKDRQHGNQNNEETKHASSTPRTPKQSARRLSVDELPSGNSSPLLGQLDYCRGGIDGAGNKTLGTDVRMSKRELLDEMKKEKLQHHRQIRQLQCELQKFRHSDPVTSLELDQTDINYKTEDLVGEGTFSCVYKGEFKGSEVAVKQLKIPLQQSDKNYFAAEVSLLKELRHPRVVLLIGVCTSGKLPVMVLEFMSQGSLYNNLHNPDCDSLDHALYYQISRDIALGMNYLHSHKPEVLHLDLKSMNVLLSESLRAKIADFGFSKLRLDAGLRSGRKVKSKSCGSAAPSWMSPELLDKGEITGKSDVYSFGIILWEMLTRCTPYKDCSVFQILEKVRKNKRPEIPDGTPEGLGHLIMLCWDPNPAKRPQFKDILQMLENLAFPPAWRELFQEAGVPESALHDVQSTRTIISLVTGTLDSGKSGILHSFLVAHTGKGDQSGRKDKIETETTYREDISLRKKKQNDKSSARNSAKSSSRSSKISSLGSSRLGDWDNDTVTSISEKTSSEESSEFTLKNLRESSSDDENNDKPYSDESSLLSSDDDNIYSKSKVKENVPKTEINVVIPNLELSLQSVRDEFRAERQKISKDTADWVYVSLDDRTDRSEQIKNNNRTKNEMHNGNDIEDMKLRLSSSFSNRSPTPPSPIKLDTSTLNESARNRRRNKAKDLNRYSEEYLMRESSDNRRPPSPVKKKSLSKKILENPGRKSASDNFGPTRSDDFIEKHQQDEKIYLSTGIGSYSSTRTNSFAERSYDSFFDVSVERPSLSEKQNKIAMSQQQAGYTSFNDRFEDMIGNEDTKKEEKVEYTGIKTISNESEICVEDMENEVMSESNSDRGKFTKNYIDSDNYMKNGQNAVNKTLMVDEVTSQLKTQTPETVPITTDNISFRQEQDKRNKPENLSSRSIENKFRDTKSFDHGCKSETEMISNRSKSRGSMSGSVNRKENPRNSETDSSCRRSSSQKFDVSDNRDGFTSSRSVEIISDDTSSKILVLDERDIEKKMSTDLKNEIKNIHKPSRNKELQHKRKQIDTSDSLEMKESENILDVQPVRGSSEHKTDQASKSLAEVDNVSSRGANDDGIRVVLNTMLASRDRSLKDGSTDINPESIDSNTALSNAQMQNKSCEADNVQEENEQIRVKLDLTEIDGKERKKKPVITPRRSLMLNSSINACESTVNSKMNVNKDDCVEDKSIGEIYSEKHTILNGDQELKSKTSVSLDGAIEKGKNRDSGAIPKRRSLPKHCESLTCSESDKLVNTDKKSEKLDIEMIEKAHSPKKNTIRVTLRKDPLAPKIGPDSSSQKKDVPFLTRDLSSPIPPPPPPPPVQVTKSVSLVSKSVQNNAPRGSMADELKSRLNKRQSVSEGMLRGSKASGSNMVTKQSPGQTGKEILVPCQNNGAPKLVKISEMNETLTPQQSDGLPSFVLQSMELQDQKDNLKSISKPHPHQLDDLSNASQEQLTSIADILKKAVMGRRLAMKEDGDSVSQSLESAATGWSIDL